MPSLFFATSCAVFLRYVSAWLSLFNSIFYFRGLLCGFSEVRVRVAFLV